MSFVHHSSFQKVSPLHTSFSSTPLALEIEKAHLLVKQAQTKGLSSAETRQVQDCIALFHELRLSDVTEARKQLIYLLTVPIEKIQLEVLERLIPLFDLSTVKNAFDSQDIEGFAEHEIRIYQVLKDAINSHASLPLIQESVALYENVLEHMWLLPYLDASYLAIRTRFQDIIHRVKELELLMSTPMEGLHCQMSRLSSELSPRCTESLMDLKKYFQSDQHLILRCRIGDLYFSLQEPQRALYHYERAFAFVKVWESYHFEVPSDLKATIYLGQEKGYRLMGKKGEAERVSCLAADALKSRRCDRRSGVS